MRGKGKVFDVYRKFGRVVLVRRIFVDGCPVALPRGYSSYARYLFLVSRCPEAIASSSESSGLESPGEMLELRSARVSGAWVLIFLEVDVTLT